VGVRVGVGAWGGCPQTGHSPSHLKTKQPQCVVLGIYVPEHRKGRDPFAPGLVKKTPLHVARRPWPGEKHIRGGIILLSCAPRTGWELVGQSKMCS
jgi:hypothetical protein